MTKLALSVEEVAAVLGVGETLTRRMVREGTVPSFRLGRRILIPRAELECWLTRIAKGAGAPAENEEDQRGDDERRPTAGEVVDGVLVDRRDPAQQGRVHDAA